MLRNENKMLPGRVVQLRDLQDSQDKSEYRPRTSYHLPGNVYRKCRILLYCIHSSFHKQEYLATFEATKKWTMQLHNWGKIYGELSIMYEGRLPD